MTTPTLTLRKRTALVAAVALLAIGGGGVAVSGAYFTDQKSIESNSVATSTVKLGDIKGNGFGSSTALSVTDLLPLPDDSPTTVASSAKAFSVIVNNTGAATIDWAASIIQTSAAGTNANPTAAEALFVSYSTDGGTNWSTGVSLSSLATSMKTTPITGKGLKANDTQEIKFLAWLPSTTSNTYQGTSAKFTLRVRAIQTGVDVTKDSNFPTPSATS